MNAKVPAPSLVRVSPFAPNTVGFTVSVLHSPSSIGQVVGWDRHREELEPWVRSLKPPVAVLGVHDARAAMVINICEHVGLRMPADVAVMGVNDDATTCNMCHPSLTSVDRNSNALGRQAAETLARLMAGEHVPEETLVPPGAVHERASTQTLAIDHPRLLAAIQFMEARLVDVISVDQVADASGKSRRWLEAIFRQELGCSPAKFLKRRRVQDAIGRLSNAPNVALGVLARKCGFTDTRQLNAAFREVVGMSVKEFNGTDARSKTGNIRL